MARFALALICLVMGSCILQEGSDRYSPKLHAYRRMLLPNVSTHIHENISVDQTIEWIVQGVGITLCVAGALFMMRFNRTASFLLLIISLF